MPRTAPGGRGRIGEIREGDYRRVTACGKRCRKAGPGMAGSEAHTARLVLFRLRFGRLLLAFGPVAVVLDEGLEFLSKRLGDVGSSEKVVGVAVERGPARGSVGVKAELRRFFPVVFDPSFVFGGELLCGPGVRGVGREVEGFPGAGLLGAGLSIELFLVVLQGA